MAYSRALHRFTVATAICTFLLIVAGGLVTSTGSGLSVPDWPNTYGHFMFFFPADKMIGGIFYEHSHRMIATVVGFLILVLAFWLWRREPRRRIRALGFTALGAVVAQGLLGGLTVLLLLPPAISVSHAALAQTVFAIVTALALFTSKWWRDARELPGGPAAGRPLVMLGGMTTLAIFIQLLIGALMRHTQSGLAIPDFPLAYGQLFPSLAPDALAGYNARLAALGLHRFADAPLTAAQVAIHLAHRFWAVVVSGMVIATAWKLFRVSGRSRRLKMFGYLMIGLLALQATLGALTVLSRKAVDVTTAHVAIGALLLAAGLLTTLHAAKLFGVRLAKPVLSGSAAQPLAGEARA